MFTPQNLISDRPPFQSLLRITLNLVLGFAILGPIVGLALGDAIYEGDLLVDTQKMNFGPGFIDAMFLMQGAATLIGLIVLPVIHITRLEHKSLTPLFPAQPDTFLMLLIVASIGLTFPTAISPISEWNINVQFPEFMSGFEKWASQEEERLGKITEALTDFRSVGDLIIALVVMALLPAIGEELVFRGMLQQELWRATHKSHLAIWASAILFSAIHMQFYGFVPRVLLGALFGYLYYWSGNLLIPIFSHFVNNALIVIIIFMNRMKMIEIDIENGEAAPLPFVLFGSIFAAGMIYYTWKHYKNLSSETTPPNHPTIN